MIAISRSRLGLLLLLLAPTLPLAAQQAAADTLAVQLAKGKSLYEGKGLCATCHGTKGEGVLGPTLALHGGKGWLHTKGTLPEVVALITAGVPIERAKGSTAMPPKGGSRLTDAEIDLVARYVLELHRRPLAATKDSTKPR